MVSAVEKQAGSLQELILTIARIFCYVVRGKPMQYEGVLNNSAVRNSSMCFSMRLEPIDFKNRQPKSFARSMCNNASRSPKFVKKIGKDGTLHYVPCGSDLFVNFLGTL